MPLPKKTLLKQLPYYLLLLPLFFVLHGYVEYYDIVYLKDVSWLFIQYLALTGVLWLIFGLLFKDKSKGALFSFLLLCFFFFFGALHDQAKAWFGNLFFTRYSFILPVTLLLFIFLFLYLKRTGSKFRKMQRYLLVLLILLIAMDFLFLIPKMTWDLSAEKNTAKVKEGNNYPDVYFILTDEYAGLEQLKTVFNYDNKPFEDQLRNRGFHVVEASQSNYNMTIYSLASILNMEYLEGIEKEQGKKDIKLCFSKINRSKVAKYFSAKGYEIINNSIFNFSNKPPHVSTSLLPPKLDVITGQTFLGRILKDIVPTLLVKWNFEFESASITFKELHINREIEARIKLEAKKQSEKPKFVYGHFIMPHGLYYYDSQGKIRDSQFIKRANYVDPASYLEYLKYSNGKFLQIIDVIQSNTNHNAVIVFVSDHGYRFYENLADRKYEFSNIHAVYLPGKDYNAYYLGMSNVNSFRVVINSIFNESLPLLRDSTIYIKSGFRDDKYAYRLTK